MSETTTSGGDLHPETSGRRVSLRRRLKDAIFGAGQEPDAVPDADPDQGPIRDPEGLRGLVCRDRIRRKLTWHRYAAFLGVHLSTLHKIAQGKHRASELTEARIRERIAEEPAE